MLILSLPVSFLYFLAIPCAIFIGFMGVTLIWVVLTLIMLSFFEKIMFEYFYQLLKGELTWGHIYLEYFMWVTYLFGIAFIYWRMVIKIKSGTTQIKE